MRKNQLKILDLLKAIEEKYEKTFYWERLDTLVLAFCQLIVGETIHFVYMKIESLDDSDQLMHGKLEKVEADGLIIDGTKHMIDKIYVYHPFIFSQLILK